MTEQNVLYAALADKTGAELLNEKVSDRQLRFMVRVRKGPNTTMWLAVIDRLLELADSQTAPAKWTIDISKQYFRRPDLKFGWRVILQGENLAQYYEPLAREVLAVHPNNAGKELQEVPLHGSPNRKVGRPVLY